MSVIEATVPMATLPNVLIILPTLISVVKDVPEPVIFEESVEEVIVPVRDVFGQAVALQLPVVLLVTGAACNVTAIKSNNAASNKLAGRSLINCGICFFTVSRLYLDVFKKHTFIESDCYV